MKFIFGAILVGSIFALLFLLERFFPLRASTRYRR